ncbi:MAG: transporter [Bacteroidetes bacterium HGW-Bacteroidetes-11]|jgi:putative transport protein|nr:MAG: transporter [Bacteroidetes bacterium HGW-Bacteroidetes-11]
MDSIISVSYLALFLIISLGLVVGKAKIRGFSLDISAVIFIAMLLGHFGFRLPSEYQHIGLLLFIFTIGIQSGPGFFRSFKQYGKQLFIIASIIIASGALITWLLSSLMNIDKALAVGLFNGAMTSTPGLAAAVEVSNSPMASIGYGIAYPFGVIGVVLFVSLIPKILRINFKKSEEEFNLSVKQSYPEFIPGNFRVENPNIDGKSLVDLKFRSATNCVISRVKHDGVTITPGRDTVLHYGDVIRALGTAEDLENVKLFVGPQTEEELQLDKGHDVQWVLVTSKQVINKPLQKLNLGANYDATVVRIRRSGIEIRPMHYTMLRFGDRLMVATSRESMKQVVRLLGNDDKRLSETDFLPITLGIVIGILVGMVKIPVFGIFDFSLGITGGVLAAALVLSGIGKTGPIIWSMSSNANQLFRELGLLMFLATVGCEAGGHIEETFINYGAGLIAAGAAITIIPLIIALIVGRVFLKMNFLTLMGVMTGGMTSTPGLAAINTQSDSGIAQVSYAAVYPLALVLMIIFSNIIFKLPSF